VSIRLIPAVNNKGNTRRFHKGNFKNIPAAAAEMAKSAVSEAVSNPNPNSTLLDTCSAVYLLL